MDLLDVLLFILMFFWTIGFSFAVIVAIRANKGGEDEK